MREPVFGWGVAESAGVGSGRAPPHLSVRVSGRAREQAAAALPPPGTFRVSDNAARAR